VGDASNIAEQINLLSPTTGITPLGAHARDFRKVSF
jgi:hypothetical protein